jgi:hypothetical protein
MEDEPTVASTPESREESRRVITRALEAITKIIEQVNQGEREQVQTLPQTQSCRMAML